MSKLFKHIMYICSNNLVHHYLTGLAVGTLFAVKGLVSAGRTYENSSSIRKACSFLLSKQLSTGGWGETYPSTANAVILDLLSDPELV